MTSEAKTLEDLLDELSELRQQLELLNPADRENEQDEKSLEKKVNFLSNIFSSLPEGISIMDRDMNILYVNPAMARLYGQTRSLIGRKCYQTYHGRDQRCPICPCADTLRTGDPCDEIIPLRGPEGEIKGWHHISSFLFLNPDTDQAYGVIEYVRDITKEKLIEDALRESEEKYRTILNTIEDGYYEVDLGGRLTFFSDSMALINGYSKEEMEGMSYRQYTDKENAQKLFQEFNRVYRTGEPSRGIYYEVITKNGEKRNLETSVSIIRDVSGKPVGFRGIARTISEL